jgi:predicted aspartyl protease
MLSARSHDQGDAVFDQINGLPVHILVIHAAVVFVPLLALGAIVYALVPRVRARIGWAVIALAVVSPIVTFVSRASGEKFYDRKIAAGVQGEFKAALDEHMGFGSKLFLFVLALGIVTLVLTLLTARQTSSLPKVADIALGVIMVVLAVISGYYVYKTGDSGAHAAWEGQ